METYAGVNTYYAKNRKAWRSWLRDNGEIKKTVWLIIYKKSSGKDSVSYEEAVEEALCFGWIDSKPNKRDQESYYQFFARRNPKSNWSKINKDRVKRLIDNGLMTSLGLDLIDQSKVNGAWSFLNKIDKLVIPSDLKKALKSEPQAALYFQSFPPSIKKGILEWILNAKRIETRNKRIQETVTLAKDNIRANQYRRLK